MSPIEMLSVKGTENYGPTTAHALSTFVMFDLLICL